VLLAVLVLSGCKDEGEDRYREAAAQYQQLLEAGKSSADPGFDAVLGKLRQVPTGSKARGKADALAQSIERGRGPKLGRPLALPAPQASDEPEVAAQQAECARQAQALGNLSGLPREQAERRLADCRRSVQQLEELRHQREGP
jgi:hypothetical protein